METWLPVVGFENYQVSNLGRIRSINGRKGSRANVNGGILNGWIQVVRPGYSRRLVALRKDGKTQTKKVHRLVLEAFIGPCPTGQEGCHQDGNSLDNNILNLKWGTHAENIFDSISHGTKTSPPIHSGESHPNSTLTSAQIRMIQSRTFKRGDQAKLARELHVAGVTISRIRRRISRVAG